MSRKNRRLSPDHYIHVNARTNNREVFPLELPEVWNILTDYLFLLRSGFDIRIHSFVLMPNHFHLLVTDPKLMLPKGMEHFMRETSREIGRKSGRINKIWGGPYHSTIIETALHYYHAYKYIYCNPVKDALVSRPQDYKFSTLQMLLGQENSIVPLEYDFTFFGDIEGVISWLNRPYKEKHWEEIRKALKRKTFELALDKSSKNKSWLENLDSIPFLSDGRKNSQK